MGAAPTSSAEGFSSSPTALAYERFQQTTFEASGTHSHHAHYQLNSSLFKVLVATSTVAPSLAKLAPPELPPPAFTQRAFELSEFIQSKHSFASIIGRQTRLVINFIVTRAEQPYPPPASDSSRRSRSPSNSPVYHWPQAWAIDKTELRRDLTNFEFNTLYILRYIESTPTPSDISEHTEEIRRDSMAGNGEGSGSGSRQPPATGAGFTPEQWASLTELIRSIAAVQPQPTPAATPPPPDANQREWKAEEVGFFDPGLEDANDASITTVGRHSFYRDVYAFVDRLKDMAKQRPSDKLRTILPECFRGEAQIWYSVELSEFEKDLLRAVPLEQWYEALVKRFKTRTPRALELLQREKYTLGDARSSKHPRVFAQNILRHAKAAEVGSIQNQLTMAWNNLAVEFRIHIPEPTASTTVRHFMEQLDGQADMWMELARRPVHGFQSSNRLAKQPSSSAKQGQHQRTEEKLVPYYGQPPTGVPYYPRQSYDNNRPQYASRPFVPRSLPQGKQPLMLESGNGSPSRKPTPANPSRSSQRKAFEKRVSWRKPVAYATAEDEDEAAGEEATDEQELIKAPDPDGYYVEDPDLDYYNPSYQPEEEENTPTALSVSLAHVCRRCHKEFKSNNLLHKHVRARDCVPAKDCNPKPSANALFSAAAYHGEVEIIPSTASIKDLGTGFGFRNYHFLTLFIALTALGVAVSVCIDTGCSVTLIDRTFLLEQAPDIHIRTMASPISVRGIGSNHHSTNQYVLLEMYLPGKRNGKDVRAKITREAHLVDGLKAKMLLGTDIIGPEKIDIIASKNQAFIGSCATMVDIDLKPRSRGVTMKPVVAEKTTTLPPRSQMVLPVHHASLPDDRDLLFEPTTATISLYAHLVDGSFHSVMARNDSDEPVVVPKHLRLGTVSEIDYDNCYQISPMEADLAMLPATSNDAWYQKELVALNKDLVARKPPADSTPVVHSATEASTIAPAISIAAGHEETKLPNGVTVFGKHDSPATRALRSVIENHPQLWQDHGSFAKLDEQYWMRIPLRADWEDHAPSKVRVYPLGTKDKQVVDKVFDKLQEQGRLSWTDSVGTGSTPFSYPVFVVWKTLPNGERQGRPVIDIRGLNKIAQNDVHPVPLQADMISFVQGCKYITILDALSFFYHWRVHPEDRHKLTVISHRGQETFNVAVMGYKGSVAYVQRQIDRILREHKAFAKAYVDDIVVASRSLEEHLRHLNQIFETLINAGICIKPSKAYVGFPSVKLLGEHVNSLGLSTSEEKVRAISMLSFPNSLRKLEAYLGLTCWLRKYVSMYAGLSKPLQDRKTELLKDAPKSGTARKSFSARTRFEPTRAEIDSFNAVQAALSQPTFLTHFDANRVLFVDLDSSKEFGIGAMVYHVKGFQLPPNLTTLAKPSADKVLGPADLAYPARQDVEPILFLSRIINGAESRYWPTELELAGIVWVVRKIRHMIESSATPTIIYTDHGAALGIAKQTTLTTTSTDKMNLRLVRASDYLQRFELVIRHKPGKQHVVPDALSRLENTYTDPMAPEEGELDALVASLAYCYATSLVEMSEEFRQRLIDGYATDPAYKHINKVLDVNGDEDAAKLPFVRGPDGLIFRLDVATGDHAYTARRLCVPQSCVKDILQIAHGEGHPGYARCLEKASAWYIRHLAKHVREYIRHCPDCQIYQTKRHTAYGSMQPIESPPVPFHTITIDFILALPLSEEGFDNAMSVTCKFTKRVTIAPGKTTWSARDWAKTLLNQLALVDWGLPKLILSDRDRKFLGELWAELFKLLGVQLLYSTAYHPQTDGQSERTNQTIEIALRYYLSALDDPKQWPTVLPRLQSYLNNSISATTGKTPNEAAYGFTPVAALDLWKLDTGKDPSMIDPTAARLAVADAIAFAQMRSKFYYDQSHKPLRLEVGQYALLRLHKGYHIPSAKSRKLGMQRVGPFKILEKVGRLAYKLELPPHWRVHPVISVAHLEPAPCPGDDPYKRPRPAHPPALSMEGDVGVYDIEKLIDRRQSRRGSGWCIEYLVRWVGYGPEYDVWYNIKDLDDAPDLIRECDQRMGLSKASTTTLATVPKISQPSTRTSLADTAKKIRSATPSSEQKAIAVLVPTKATPSRPASTKPSADEVSTTLLPRRSQRLLTDG